MDEKRERRAAEQSALGGYAAPVPAYAGGGYAPPPATGWSPPIVAPVKPCSSRRISTCTCPRGSWSKAYHSFGYFNLRDYGLVDKKAAIENLAARHTFIDITRVGIYGHSGGGFMSAAALLVPPYNTFFKAAVASSGDPWYTMMAANKIGLGLDVAIAFGAIGTAIGFVLGLGAGLTNVFATSLVMPRARPADWTGTNFYIVMRTDSADQVAESNEANNAGEIGARQSRDRQRDVGKQAGDDQRHRHQQRRDGTADAEFGDRHRPVSAIRSGRPRRLLNMMAEQRQVIIGVVRH